jgi:hypothetical protein
MPSFMINIGLYIVEGKIKDMVGVNIFETDFKMYLNLLQIPAFFIYSMTDIVVK